MTEERADDSAVVMARANSWAKLLTNYGLTAVLLMGLVWYVVIPLKDSHLQFLKDQTESIRKLVEVSDKQADILKESGRTQEEILVEQKAQRSTLERINSTLLRTENLVKDPELH